MNTTLWSRCGRDHPLITLFALFVAWKSLIALIVLASPGVGYDTSTSLVSSGNGFHNVASNVPEHMRSSWLKFVRWDAIYYTHMSEQGHVFEQEWAFGVGLSTAISWAAERTAAILNTLVFADATLGLSELGLTDNSSSFIVGIALSHASHWLSVVQLWALTRTLIEGQKHFDSKLPFTTAALHIISPAGVFLSAPQSESLFSFLSMSGFLGYVCAVQHFNKEQVFAGCATMVCAGMASSAATMVRSNGILAGIPFFIEAIAAALGILSKGLSGVRFTRLASVIVGGLFVGFGLVYPQMLAYQEYCSGRNPGGRRPWCERTIPSIFTWVQSHYWNVGPFRYWTVSNLPLFLLAAPSLWLLIHSAVDILWRPHIILPGTYGSPALSVSPIKSRIWMSLALPQLVLAVLALTSYHVQIITRLSSGYPLWYIWLATKLQDEPRKASRVIRWMVVYGLIQAGLYACFLPPA